MSEAKFHEGLAHQRDGRLEQAQKSYREVLKVQPRHFGALFLSGAVAVQMGRFEQAVGYFDKALAIDGRHVEAHYNRGVALQNLDKLASALESYDRALLLNPRYAAAHNNRGNILSGMKRHEEALECYARALSIRPDYPDALNNRGLALRELKQYPAALESFDAAVRYAPTYAAAHYNRGTVFVLLERYQDAVACFDRALKYQPEFADAYVARGTALKELKNQAAAVSSYDRALALDPDLPFVPGMRLHTKMQVCDWRDVDKDIARLNALVLRGKAAAASTSVLALTDDPVVHRKAAEIWTKDRAVHPSHVIPLPPLPRRDKIRIGYFSMDFRVHPVSSLMVGLIEAHDRTRFEVYGFSYGLDTQDETRLRLEAAFDKFFDVSAKSDSEIAALARAHGVEIAVDLAGHTGEARTEIMAHRVAPVQVNYLGYPGTMGADYMDYIVGDVTVIPETDRRHYAEKVVTLPHSYQVNDPKRIIGDTTFSRAALGLPETGFVFCCFNNTYKILPETFDRWMRILKSVDGSVLWLFEDNPGATDNLRKEAVSRGVDPQRLIFAPRMKRADHLARHRAADLFIDTLPYNAHTTASDALWAGLPVLTLMGRSFASRVGGSLVRAAGLPELVAESPAAYEMLAVDLAKNPERAMALKKKLMAHRLTCSLFDLGQFTRHIEDAYAQMSARYHEGQRPEHLVITA